MRSSFLAFAAATTALSACGSNGSSPSPEGGTPADATLDAVFAASDAEPQLDAQTCSGDPTACLFGAAHIQAPDDGGFGFPIAPTEIQASLFRTFPSAGVNPIAAQVVARDNTWAFSGLDPWAHYYVQFEPGFPKKAGVARTVVTRVGPLAIPNGSAGPIDVQVKPVQLDVFEASSPSVAATAEAASARLSEASEGASSVSIQTGNTATTMPYDATTHAYSLTFASPPPAAQSTYQIVTSSGSGNATWTLVANPPTFTGTIASPAPAAMLHAGDAIPVTWSPEPADYIVVELFVRTQGRWATVYTSSPPDSADASSEMIPGKLQDGGLETPAGSYLLNVSFTNANCPATADGCVHSSTVANEQLTIN